MEEAYIVEAVRTPVGKRNGVLSGIRADDLAAIPLTAIVKKTGIDPKEIDDVIMGCVTQVGEQGLNIARMSALIAGFPIDIPGTTVNRLCGSSQQAVHFAAQAIISGAMDLVIASGVESMTRVPIYSDAFLKEEFIQPSPNLISKHEVIHQGISAELIAERWKISRQEMDEFSYMSHMRAVRAQDGGKFDDEIVPVDVVIDGRPFKFTKDEGPRRDTTVEKIASLKPAFKPDGLITAANSSQISDGAAAVMITSKEKAEKLGLKKRAKIISMVVVGSDPVLMLTGPIPATEKILKRAGLKLEDIDLIEINEAFASVVLAWGKELDPRWEKVNVNGGAIALGHPLGATGAKLLTTLLHEMERRDVRYGLVTMCIGFGQATATIIDRKM